MTRQSKRAITSGMIVGLLIVAWTIFNIVYAYFLSHPDVEIARENRRKFAHVVVLIDGTRSMRDGNFAAAKQVVSRGIIPSIGIEDIAVGYDIRPTFTLANTIFGGTVAEQPPQTSDDHRSQMLRVLDRNRESSQRGVVDDDVYSLIRELNPLQQNVEKVRRDWAERVENLRRPERLGSDICGPLRATQEEFRARLDRQAEKWLFILSDFVQDSSQYRSCPPPDPDAFGDTNIVLIYPFDSDSLDWQKVETYWKGYFRDKKLERLPFADAQRRRFVFPPNPTSGLEQHQIKSFGEYFWPLMRIELIVVGALIILALVLIIIIIAKSRRIDEKS